MRFGGILGTAMANFGLEGDSVGRAAITNTPALALTRKYMGLFVGTIPKSLRIKKLDTLVEDVVTYNHSYFKVFTKFKMLNLDILTSSA